MIERLHFQEMNHGITCIDMEFFHTGIACCYLIEDNGKYALVETGPGNSVPILLEFFRIKDIPMQEIEYILVTHIHLDHAGGAGLLMQHLPNAKLVVHPRGLKHMVDPAKLLAGATEVYGEEELMKNFGEIRPIPQERILEATDGFRLRLGDRELEFLDTPGHAKHHNCIWDARSNGMFTGDTFGISYRPFDTEKGPFISASSSPVQFDPESAHRSLDKILTYNPQYVYLTHYGRLENVVDLAQKLHKSIDELKAIAKESYPEPDRFQEMKDRIEKALFRKLRDHRCTMNKEEILKFWQIDIMLNAQGLECWLKGYPKNN